MRIEVECAFGGLVARWGWLWRKSRFKLGLVNLMFGVSCKLHNICVDQWLDNVDARARGARLWGDDDGGGHRTPAFTNDFPYEASVDYGADQQRLPHKASQQKQHAWRERLANFVATTKFSMQLERPKKNKNSKM